MSVTISETQELNIATILNQLPDPKAGRPGLAINIYFLFQNGGRFYHYCLFRYSRVD